MAPSRTALLSSHPGKAAVERWWLAYTPVWGLATGAVMITGWAESWGDVECMVFGLLVAFGALVPMVRPHASERALPWHQRAGVKLCLSVLLFAFGLNWVQTPFFFDVLHMHYGFGVTWTIDRNPIFLYLVTVAYFGTYCALCSIAFRWLTPRARWAAWLIAPVAMAFLETVLNANPFMSALFCYDDMGLMLGFGSAIYGFSLVVALPMWMAIDESPEHTLPTRMVFVHCAAALFAIGLFLAVARHFAAPSFTTVVEDAPGLGAVEGSCLEP
jgi:cycloeucalenol cycloisomerase